MPVETPLKQPTTPEGNGSRKEKGPLGRVKEAAVAKAKIAAEVLREKTRILNPKNVLSDFVNKRRFKREMRAMTHTDPGSVAWDPGRAGEIQQELLAQRRQAAQTERGANPEESRRLTEALRQHEESLQAIIYSHDHLLVLRGEEAGRADAQAIPLVDLYKQRLAQATTPAAVEQIFAEMRRDVDNRLVGTNSLVVGELNKNAEALLRILPPDAKALFEGPIAELVNNNERGSDFVESRLQELLGQIKSPESRKALEAILDVYAMQKLRATAKEHGFGKRDSKQLIDNSLELFSNDVVKQAARDTLDFRILRDIDQKIAASGDFLLGYELNKDIMDMSLNPAAQEAMRAYFDGPVIQGVLARVVTENPKAGYLYDKNPVLIKRAIDFIGETRRQYAAQNPDKPPISDRRVHALANAATTVEEMRDKGSKARQDALEVSSIIEAFMRKEDGTRGNFPF